MLHLPIVIILFCVFKYNAVFAATFDRCDLAKTLYFAHRFSYEQVAMWVCLAKYQSNFNAAAINYDSDGIGYHGLYQISDRYWCSSSSSSTADEINACSIPCQSLRDNDLTDDFTCIRQIFAEHERISGSGYAAWTAYASHCSRDYRSVIADCFPPSSATISPTIEVQVQRTIPQQPTTIQQKVYHRCELARELRFVHSIPAHQIATWVCIAHHESQFNTSAIGRSNADGSADHGLFQISDIYWCSPPGWVCGLSCSRLEDSDITDDVECMQRIFNEHQKISGDGFTAWTVYRPHCQRYQVDEYVEGCFDDNDANSILPARRPAVTSPSIDHHHHHHHHAFTAYVQRYTTVTYVKAMRNHSLCTC